MTRSIQEIDNIVESGSKATIKVPFLQLKQFADIYLREPYIIQVKPHDQNDWNSGIIEFSYIIKGYSKEESWKTYAIRNSNDILEGILIRHSVWDKSRDGEFLKQNKQLMDFDKLPSFTSSNVFCSYSNQYFHDYIKCLSRGLRYILKGEITETTENINFIYKQVCISHQNYDCQIGWSSNSENSEVETWVNQMLGTLIKLLNTSPINNSEVFLDYICPLEIYQKYIFGDE